MEDKTISLAREFWNFLVLMCVGFVFRYYSKNIPAFKSRFACKNPANVISFNAVNSIGSFAYAENVTYLSIAPLKIGVILKGLFDEIFRRFQLAFDSCLSLFVTRVGAATLLAANILLILNQIPSAKNYFSNVGNLWSTA